MYKDSEIFLYFDDKMIGQMMDKIFEHIGIPFNQLLTRRGNQDQESMDASDARKFLKHMHKFFKYPTENIF